MILYLHPLTLRAEIRICTRCRGSRYSRDRNGRNQPALPLDPPQAPAPPGTMALEAVIRGDLVVPCDWCEAA